MILPNRWKLPNVRCPVSSAGNALTAGFVYFADGLSTDVVLNIHGRHVFKSAGGGQTDLTWETTIGFSGRSFRAAVAVDMAASDPSAPIVYCETVLPSEFAT